MSLLETHIDDEHDTWQNVFVTWYVFYYVMYVTPVSLCCTSQFLQVYSISIHVSVLQIFYLLN